MEQLDALAASLFGERDPGEIFFVGKSQEILEEGEDYVLQLPLPHVELSKVKMTKRGDELFISIGNFKREMLLPAILAQRNAGGAVFNNGMLQVRFPQSARCRHGIVGCFPYRRGNSVRNWCGFTRLQRIY
ncbi:MAG: hypothetical protein R2932_15660 [Caldilineaceae bacterium]